MAKFKLNNDLAKNIAEAVNNVEVKDSFNIRNIDINLLIPSDKNFYRVEDIEKLAEDIEINGLYHNLIVRRSEGEKYEILSGERRYKALRILCDRGNNKYSKVPCQVRDNLNDVDAEIILIQSNAEVRQLSEIEKIKQIGRLEKLYKEKKKKGQKIPGRLRDKIGEDIGLSGIQVQRYKKIGRDLIPELKEMLESNRIGMADAFNLSSLAEDKQNAIYNFLKLNKDVSVNEANNKLNKDKKVNRATENIKRKIRNSEENEINQTQNLETDDVDEDNLTEDESFVEKEEFFNKSRFDVNDLGGVDNKSVSRTETTVMETSKNLMFIKNNIKSIKRDYLLELQKSIEVFLYDLNNYLK